MRVKVFIPTVLLITHIIVGVFYHPAIFLGVADGEILREGDIVRLNQTLWVEGDIIDFAVIISAYIGETIPESLLTDFPDALTLPRGLWTELIGKRVGASFTVNVAAKDGFKDTESPYYGKDLTFWVELYKLLYDSAPKNVGIGELPFFNEILFLIVVLVGGYLVMRTSRYGMSVYSSRQSGKCLICGEISQVVCGNNNCNTRYCKRCFREEGKCRECGSNKFVPI